MSIKTEISDESGHMREPREFPAVNIPPVWPARRWSASTGPGWCRLLHSRLAHQFSRSGSTWRSLEHQNLLHGPPSQPVRSRIWDGIPVFSVSHFIVWAALSSQLFWVHSCNNSGKQQIIFHLSTSDAEHQGFEGRQVTQTPVISLSWS